MAEASAATAIPPVIGASVARIEGPEKVSGRALYAADVPLPGALWGMVLRSPLPHARILSVDTTAARQAPGVKAVITGKDVAGHLMGRRIQDMPVLCWDKVRFIGDRVAAVAAGSRDAAEEAVGLIRVEYEELPAVFDVLEAMKPEAPRVHDDVRAYKGGEDAELIPEVPNGLTLVRYGKGDVEWGFRESDLVLEHTFRVPVRHTGYIEPHAGLVYIDPEARVQVWACSKAPFRLRKSLAQAVGLPEERIRVNPVSVGGDFGGKGDAMDLPIAYFLAVLSGRPVKMVMSYTEELTAGDPDHPAVVTVRTGVKRDGRVVARHVRAFHSSGAYGAYKPTPDVAIPGVSHGAGPYRMEHALLEGFQIYTNTVPHGFYRGPGAPAAIFASESQMDLLAQELGMDPLELRLRNILRESDVNAIGFPLHDVRAREVLEKARDAARWRDPKPGRHYGRGVAMFEKSLSGGPTGVILSAGTDGAVTLLSPVFDQGVGVHTVLQQITAAELDLPLSQLRVQVGDTDSAPYDQGVGASRTTHTAGQATVKACSLLVEALRGRAAELLECPVDEVVYRAGQLFPREAPQRRMTVADVVARTGGGSQVSVTANVEMKPADDISCFVAQVAEVEVDVETGRVRLHRFVTAHDVGTIINPITHQGQIEGGVVQGIGQGLTEELILQGGRVSNPNLGEYKLPTVADIPELETVLVPDAGGPAPYGGRAIGEMAACSPAAAIANAVADAVGVRIMDLPVTAEKVYRELKKRDRLPAV